VTSSVARNVGRTQRRMTSSESVQCEMENVMSSDFFLSNDDFPCLRYMTWDSRLFKNAE
jgi:hypothetical protein